VFLLNSAQFKIPASRRFGFNSCFAIVWHVQRNRFFLFGKREVHKKAFVTVKQQRERVKNLDELGSVHAFRAFIFFRSPAGPFIYGTICVLRPPLTLLAFLYLLSYTCRHTPERPPRM